MQPRGLAITSSTQEDQLRVPTYESDLAAWMDGTVQRLREKDFAAVDVDALIEELDSVGGCERSAIENDLYQLLYHLLKLTHAPALDLERAGRQWRLSINESRHGQLIATGRSTVYVSAFRDTLA